MSALLDLHPDGTHPVLSGVAEVHELLDRMHAGAAQPLVTGEQARVVVEVDRAIRRLEALKLKLVAAADKTGAAKAAGFTDTGAWVAKQTTTSRAVAAREVALATNLREGHDATAEALDDGRVSSGHAAVIVHATGQLPDTVSAEQRQVVEAHLVEQAARYSPDQLRRVARRSIESVEPDQQVVDAHENELIRSEEQAARDKCSLSLHDNGDGTTTGQFTVPALAAAMLGKVIDAMTAPRRMREAAGPRPVVRLAAPPRTRVRRAPRAPAHRPPAQQDRRHRDRHHRPHRPHRSAQGSPARHQRQPLGRRSPPAGLHCRHPSRRPRRQISRSRPRPCIKAVQRVPAVGERARTHHLRCHRLRTPLRMVRAPPPKGLGPRRPHRPGQTRYRCATSTTSGSTMRPLSPPDSCPTAASDSAGERDLYG